MICPSCGKELDTTATVLGNPIIHPAKLGCAKGGQYHIVLNNAAIAYQFNPSGQLWTNTVCTAAATAQPTPLPFIITFGEKS